MKRVPPIMSTFLGVVVDDWARTDTVEAREACLGFGLGLVAVGERGGAAGERRRAGAGECVVGALGCGC
jgi:hypothetical protein